jgi:hypothetical protein
MQFRFIALIALWTCISGPIFAPIGATPSSRSAHIAPQAPHARQASSALSR